jgi:hypothetical protein
MNDRRQFRLRVPIGTLSPKIVVSRSRRFSNYGYLSNCRGTGMSQNRLGAEVAGYYGEEHGIATRNVQKTKTNIKWQVTRFRQRAA